MMSTRKENNIRKAFMSAVFDEKGELEDYKTDIIACPKTAHPLTPNMRIRMTFNFWLLCLTGRFAHNHKNYTGTDVRNSLTPELIEYDDLYNIIKI